MYTLSPSQLADYHRDGFLLVRASEHRLLADPAVLPAWSDEVRNWPLMESRGKWMPYFEDTPTGQQIMRTEKFMDYHGGFRALLEGHLRDILGQLSGQVSKLLPHADVSQCSCSRIRSTTSYLAAVALRLTWTHQLTTTSAKSSTSRPTSPFIKPPRRTAALRSFPARTK